MPYQKWGQLAGLDGLLGLGDDVADYAAADQAAAATPTDFGIPDFNTAPTGVLGSDLSTNIAQDIQTGVQDAFSFAKLFNPIPPGCTQITAPNGATSVSCSSPTSTAPSLSLPGSVGSFLPILLVVGGGLLLFGGQH